MAKSSSAAHARSGKAASAPKKVSKSFEIRALQEWKTMFALAEHWKSDLSFFQDELNFFRLLLDKYLLALIDDSHITVTRHLAHELTQSEKNIGELDREVTNHLAKLAYLVQDPFAQDSQLSRERHEQLENEMSDFVRNFRILKKEVFSVAENAAKSIKAGHLLGK